MLTFCKLILRKPARNLTRWSCQKANQYTLIEQSTLQCVTTLIEQSKIGTNSSHIFKKQTFFKMDRFQEILNTIGS